MNINVDSQGHHGAIFTDNRGRYICVCPICGKNYAVAFCRGDRLFADDGFPTREEAVAHWNKNHPESAGVNGNA